MTYHGREDEGEEEEEEEGRWWVRRSRRLASGTPVRRAHVRRRDTIMRRARAFNPFHINFAPTARRVNDRRRASEKQLATPRGKRLSEGR